MRVKRDREYLSGDVIELMGRTKTKVCTLLERGLYTFHVVYLEWSLFEDTEIRATLYTVLTGDITLILH